MGSAIDERYRVQSNHHLEVIMKAKSEPALDATKVLSQALSRWENEGGWLKSEPYNPGVEIPDLTNVEIIHLRVRLIALENLMIDVLAEGSDRQRQMACDMAAYISPRSGFTPHLLTVKAADHMTYLVDRAAQFRTVQ
jgi:hypothetical protein